MEKELNSILNRWYLHLWATWTLFRTSSCSCSTVSVCYAALGHSAGHFTCDGQQAVSFCVALFARERIAQGETRARSLLCFYCHCIVGLSSVCILAVASYHLAMFVNVVSARANTDVTVPLFLLLLPLLLLPPRISLNECNFVKTFTFSSSLSVSTVVPGFYYALPGWSEWKFLMIWSPHLRFLYICPSFFYLFFFYLSFFLPSLRATGLQAYSFVRPALMVGWCWRPQGWAGWIKQQPR